MSRVSPPFRADHVGSLLRPASVLDARARHMAGTIDAAELRSVEDTAIAEMIPKLEATGIQSITDGEFRRAWSHLDFIHDAAAYVDLDQMCLSPQCGFSSTVEGNKISEEDQWAKLRHVAQTAAEIWS